MVPPRAKGRAQSAEVEAEITNALGHIFELSITDLEELRAAAEGELLEKRSPKRKAEGVFYTPPFVTRYILEQTLGRTFREKWDVVLAKHRPDTQKGKNNQQEAWIATWEAYRGALEGIRVLDPACGAGAFLIAAFDVLRSEYERVNAALEELRGGEVGPFDLTTTLLHDNLFGVDLDGESVETTKLSLWLKTAEQARRLVHLDRNIKQANAIVADPSVDPRAFDWEKGTLARVSIHPAEAPQAAQIDARWREGFDVVIGNPPYVRHEWITEIKPHLRAFYRTYHGAADLFVYFFERGLSVLKPGGRLGFIVANKWLRSEYAGPLRAHLARDARLETLVDFGHAPIFPDADTFPCVVTMAKPIEAPRENHTLLVTTFPREELAGTSIRQYVAANHHEVPQSRLGKQAWSLLPPALEALMEKIRNAGTPLGALTKTRPWRGILTGLNEAFVVDTPTKDNLVKEDPRSAELLKKLLRGQDVGRWASKGSNTWLIFARRGVEIERYPAIKRHLESWKDALEPRPKAWVGERWPGRKPGPYAWYELQDAIDYWPLLEQDKIVYQEIQFHPSYALDTEGMFLNNKCFFIPSRDPWLLAVLNSPLMWWYNWRYLPHMKDDALSPSGVKMEALPIATPTPAGREAAEELVPRLVARTRENDTSAPRPERRREMLALERILAAHVNDAYGLTREDVALLWSSAPPRMPVGQDPAG